VDAVGLALAGDRHGDDAAALGDRPVDARQDPLVLALRQGSGVVEDLPDVDVRLEGDPVAGGDPRVVRPAGRPGTVSPVAVAVVGGEAGDERLHLDPAAPDVV